ncbi:MAG: phosphohydrolase [Lachnospiraceae bacterium]|nr:phosphohydrolase [Lachnospiraceae bacterium]
MIFVKVDDLKPGMRLGKPIYNKHGVLLHERDSKLTDQSIFGVRNFGLIGLYILEPAEPVPPMSEDDIQFERFQTVSIFSIRDDLKLMASGKAPKTLDWLVNIIIKNYGQLDRKINFIQNLRSSEDFMYKHALNLAILVAMISNQMNAPVSVQNRAVKAAIIHDVGYILRNQNNQLNMDSELTLEQEQAVQKGTQDVFSSVDIDTDTARLAIKLHENLKADLEGKRIETGQDLASDILFVAHAYDIMTAMKSYKEPTSEIMAIRQLIDHERKYEPEVVNALIKSINILNEGVCVELTNKKKGLVILENPDSIMRPMILSFDDNNIYDLSNNSTYREVQILDVMKTMDNRIKLDLDALKEYIDK